MTQTFTTQLNDVVRYLYNETSTTENVQIEESISNDANLRNFYLDSKQLMVEMDKIKMEPSKKSVSNILSFSRNYQPVL